ncbi:MAG: hypothetical protein MAG451_00361 [Anaerolineales bacterium]|nr:hypothetical protein [Anaerolineales bacterium]
MTYPFPGMDPYLEHPDIWSDLHHRLITALADTLGPEVRPRYVVRVDFRVYRETVSGMELLGRPDADVREIRERAVASYRATGSPQPQTVRVPVTDVVRQGYLQVKDTTSGEVVTVIEILSPTNKRPGKDREEYEEKRQAILDSSTHLVEVDLLRRHPPMPFEGASETGHYRILVSRSAQRPEAELYLFSVRTSILTFSLPLRAGDEEPVIDLNALLRRLYENAGYDLSIDYTRDPIPPLEGEDAGWAHELLTESLAHNRQV